MTSTVFDCESARRSAAGRCARLRSGCLRCRRRRQCAGRSASVRRRLFSSMGPAPRFLRGCLRRLARRRAGFAPEADGREVAPRGSESACRGNRGAGSGRCLDRGGGRIDRRAPPADHVDLVAERGRGSVRGRVGQSSYQCHPSGRRVERQNSVTGRSLWCRASGNHDPSADCCDGGVAQRHREDDRRLGPFTRPPADDRVQPARAGVAADDVFGPADRGSGLIRARRRKVADRIGEPGATRMMPSSCRTPSPPPNRYTTPPSEVDVASWRATGSAGSCRATQTTTTAEVDVSAAVSPPARIAPPCQEPRWRPPPGPRGFRGHAPARSPERRGGPVSCGRRRVPSRSSSPPVGGASATDASAANRRKGQQPLASDPVDLASASLGTHRPGRAVKVKPG